MTYEDILKEFSSFLLVEKGLSRSTIQSYKFDLKSFFYYIIDQTNVSKVKDNIDKISKERFLKTKIKLSLDDYSKKIFEQINTFISHLFDTNINRRSIARKISSIKSFLYFLNFDGYIKKNYHDKVDAVKYNKKIPSYLSDNDIMLFFNYVKNKCHERYYFMFGLMYYSGLRVSEVIKIKWSDFIFENNDVFLKIIGKGNKERMVPIADNLKIFINKSNNGWVFDNNNKNHITRQYVNQMIQKICIKSNVDRFSPHKLRHTFATKFLQNGANMMFLQKILGHESLKTTQIYTHVSKKDLKCLVEKFHPLVKDKD